MHARSRAVRLIGIRKKRIGACAVILVLTLSSYERELNGPIGLRLALPYRTVRAFVFGARLVGTMDQDQDQGMRGGACSAMPAAASTLGSADSPPPPSSVCQAHHCVYTQACARACLSQLTLACCHFLFHNCPFDMLRSRRKVSCFAGVFRPVGSTSMCHTLFLSR